MNGATSNEEPADEKPRFKMTKRKAAIGGAIVVAVALAAFALKKPHNPPGADATASTATATVTATSAPPAMPMPTHALPTAPVAANMAVPAGGGADEDMGGAGAEPSAAEASPHKKGGKVQPFGNGAVSHGNVLHLKMDGPIEEIEGAEQPNGFTVHIPGRKSLDAAGPLASRDARIASVKMSNDPNGVELTVAFKDGVPHYQVRAKGNTLEIALAPVGKTVAKKDPAAAKAPHAGKKKAAKPAEH